MTLWNLIRDFFVQNIFGGVASNGSVFYQNIVGNLCAVVDGSEDYAVAHTDTNFLKVGYGVYADIFDGSIIEQPNTTVYMSLGDWLSTTFTVITLILLVVFLYLFVKWIFKLFSGLLH